MTTATRTPESEIEAAVARQGALHLGILAGARDREPDRDGAARRADDRLLDRGLRPVLGAEARRALAGHRARAPAPACRPCRAV